MNKLKTIYIVLLKVIFVVTFSNAAITLGYILTNLIWNHSFTWRILWIFLISTSIWAIIGVVNNKFKLNL